MEEPLMYITKWKKQLWKGNLLYDSNYLTFWKRQNSGKSKKIDGCQGFGDGEELIEHRGFLGQWKYSVYTTMRDISLNICPNSQNDQHQAWTLMLSMDFNDYDVLVWVHPL